MGEKGPIMHNERVTYFISILSILLGGRRGSGGFFVILQNKILILLFTHDNSIFFTLYEIEFGVSDLGM